MKALIRSVTLTTALALSSMVGITASSDSLASGLTYSGTTCQPYNHMWQLCTYTYYDPGSQTWVSEQYFAPYPDQYDTIDP